MNGHIFFKLAHIALYKSYVFYSSQMRTLVAMATYSFNRLIMGKVEILKFLLSHRG